VAYLSRQEVLRYMNFPCKPSADNMVLKVASVSALPCCQSDRRESDHKELSHTSLVGNNIPKEKKAEAKFAASQ
jgi:hypothetical protein